MSTGIINNIQRMSVQDGPGLRTTVFFKGCPLKCLWCSNPESQSFSPEILYYEELCTGCGACMDACPEGAVVAQEGRFAVNRERCTGCGRCAGACNAKARELAGTEMSIPEVMDIIGKDSLFYENSGGGVTLGGGECTAGGTFFFDLVRAVKEEGFHLTVDTCGLCAEDRFEHVVELADLFLFDCKHMAPHAHKQLTGMDNTLILKNLRTALASGKEVTIRVPLIPGMNDSDENIGALAAFLAEYGRSHVEVMPCHAFGRNKYKALGWTYPMDKAYTPETLAGALARFENHRLTVQVI